jgi:hypothetical protein
MRKVEMREPPKVNPLPNLNMSTAPDAPVKPVKSPTRECIICSEKGGFLEFDDPPVDVREADLLRIYAVTEKDEVIAHLVPNVSIICNLCWVLNVMPLDMEEEEEKVELTPKGKKNPAKGEILGPKKKKPKWKEDQKTHWGWALAMIAAERKMYGLQFNQAFYDKALAGTDLGRVKPPPD